MFQIIKRISLFLLTNFAVIVMIGLIMSVLQYFGVLGQLGSLWPILIYSALFGFIWAFISLFLSKFLAKRSYNIILITAEDLPNLEPKIQFVYTTVERIAQNENITMPEVGYYESAEPNAFATGATKNSALVAVSTGLFNNMEKKEIEWVIGHEMTHIINGDMVTLTLISGIMNTFVYAGSYIVAQAIIAFLSRNDDSNESIGSLTYYVLVNIFQVIFGILAQLVIMYFSRTREYRADLGGAERTSKAAMIAGLKRLKSLQELTPTSVGSLKSFMISEPKDSIFSTHPSLENRIGALESNYTLA